MAVQAGITRQHSLSNMFPGTIVKVKGVAVLYSSKYRPFNEANLVVGFLPKRAKYLKTNSQVQDAPKRFQQHSTFS